MYDVLSAKNVTVEGKQTCEVGEGYEGQGKYCGGFYPVKIVAKGELLIICFARFPLGHSMATASLISQL